MARALLMGALASAAVAGCAARGSDGGPLVDRSYDVGTFDRIEVAGPYSVEVRTGSAVQVRANGPEKAVERMDVAVENGILQVHPRKRGGLGINWGRQDPVRLTVTVPALAGAEIAGSGDIRIDRVAGDQFKGTVAGSGNLDVAQVEVAKLTMGIAGSGRIRAGGGHAQSASYDIAGSGDLEAGELIAETASVSIAGSGNVQAHATGTASVDIAGSGNVRMGGGAQCKVSKAGSGNVDCS